MPIKITINTKKCIGCATCTLILPEVFAMSPAGHSIIREKYRANSEVEGIVPDELLENVEEAASKCLGSAISFVKLKDKQ